ncbi:MAG: flippase-like domain-containing protein, partial [Victivallales bacterium]|nr:flippase-like domain-containing protein [Victivallales bacterium]
MERIRKIALILLKLAGVALAVWLMRRTLQGVEGSLLSSLQGSVKPLIAMAVLCYGVVNFIASWRWKLLLEVQGMQVPLFSLFRLTMIGAFFSQIIPGSVSGDILKLAFVMNYGRNKGAEAALTIAVDRYIGLFGLFAVAALSCLFCLLKCPEIVMGNRVVLLAFVFVWSAFAGMPLAWYLVLARGFFMRARPVAALCGYFSSHLPGRLNGLVARLAAAIDMHRKENIAVLKAFLMSCVIHSLLAL